MLLLGNEKIVMEGDQENRNKIISEIPGVKHAK
jgi:hypothetical protein